MEPGVLGQAYLVSRRAGGLEKPDHSIPPIINVSRRAGGLEIEDHCEIA